MQPRSDNKVLAVFETAHVTLYQGDALSVLRELPAESVDCAVTSPPYWGLRDYGSPGQIGLERTPDEYVAALVEVFREVRRCLGARGTLWLNLGDSYNAYNGGAGPGSKLSGRQSAARPRLPSGYGLRFTGLKPKDLIGIPWRMAFALQADGWYLRSDIIWSKPNPMPESVEDRPTKSHEYVFMFSKSERYHFDQEAVREPSADLDGWASRNRYAYSGPKGIDAVNDRRTVPEGMREANPAGRNVRSVWEIPTTPYPDAHFATFPRELPERCIKAGCPAGGVVLDPFAGSGTTLAVARDLARKSIGIELNPAYVALIEKRCAQLALEMGA